MYKRNFVFLVIIVLLITGCTRISNNLDEVVDDTLRSTLISTNTVSTGYELYIPTGVRQVVDNEYNQKLKIKNRYVYLYVDTISYYYKNMLNYKSTNDYNYYYKEINKNGKTGYIGINKIEEDLYYCEIVYNYTKSEFYSNEADLPVILTNALIVQKSIKFNDNLIAMELDSEANDGREIKYELDSPKESESKFSDYLQEYVPETKEEVELPDENQIREVQ